MCLRLQSKGKHTDVSCFSSAFKAIRCGVKAGYKFMKRSILAAAEADWDVRLRRSHITTVRVLHCRHLIAPCLLKILNIHKKHHFVIMAKMHHDTQVCKNTSLPAVRDRENS